MKSKMNPFFLLAGATMALTWISTCYADAGDKAGNGGGGEIEFVGIEKELVHWVDDQYQKHLCAGHL